MTTGVMKLLAIMAGYRRGRTVDTLLDQALAGVRVERPDTVVDRIALVDCRISFCRNCMTCRRDDPAKPIAACPIQDDMQQIYPLLERADAFIFATPINMGRETALMKTFLERSCYVLARPGSWPLKGCPEPRSSRSRRAAFLLSSGVVPPILRYFCDDATRILKDYCHCIVNARVVGSVYAGAVDRRGVEPYLPQAFALGRKLARD